MDDSKAAHGKELPRLTAEEIVARLESLLQRLGNFSAYVDEIDDEGNVTIKKSVANGFHDGLPSG